MNELRFFTLPGQMFRPTIVSQNLERNHARIVYGRRLPSAKYKKGSSFVAYRYEDGDDKTDNVLQTLSWEEWKRWVRIAQANPVDHLMVYEWDIVDQFHIVTTAMTPDAAEIQAITEYTRMYGQKPRFSVKIAHNVHATSKAIYFPYNGNGNGNGNGKKP